VTATEYKQRSNNQLVVMMVATNSTVSATVTTEQKATINQG